MAPSTQQKKALDAKKAVLKGTHNKKSVKTRTSTYFHLPKTQALPRNPKYARKSISHYARLDEYKVVISHVNSEGAVKKIEDANTLVLKVHREANKHQIKLAVKKLYNVEVAKINTLIKPDGSKKAFVRLTADHDALDVASRVGYI